MMRHLNERQPITALLVSLLCIFVRTPSNHAFVIAPSNARQLLFDYPAHLDLRREHDVKGQRRTSKANFFFPPGLGSLMSNQNPTENKSSSNGKGGIFGSMATPSQVRVLDEVGSGSYGTVYRLQRRMGVSSHGSEDDSEDGNEDLISCIGKRAWVEHDLKEVLHPPDSEDGRQLLKKRAQRCRAFYDIEKHCFQKLQKHAKTNKSGHQLYVPRFQGIYLDDHKGHEWMVFDAVTQLSSQDANRTSGTNHDDNDRRPAMSLQDLMDLDHHGNRHNTAPTETWAHSHHLSFLSRALGIQENEDEPTSLADVDETSTAASIVAEIVVDVVFRGLLEALCYIHAHGIVHRDVKPGNVLISRSRQVHLIDFGSAADLDTAGSPLKKNIGLSESVAISPIYAAPELFINPNSRLSALNFDCFSVALIICQLLFQYLDERTDAGFHQQLQVAGWNLNTWLATELAGTVRPAGLDVALQVLAQRPGVWTLLQDMLKADPWQRENSRRALQRLEEISGKAKVDAVEFVDSSTIAATDGEFLASVLESMEYCQIPSDMEESFSGPDMTTNVDDTAVVRPLQFVATFKRRESLGLLLAEAGSVDLKEDFDDEDSRQQWQRAIADAVQGEVYVSSIVPGGQADDLGIFEIGDRIQAVGELPLAEQGFERLVTMIQQESTLVTPDPKSITLHLDRKCYINANKYLASSTTNPAFTPNVRMANGYTLIGENPIQAIDQAAWSSRGRRKSQEDRYILHEVLMYNKGASNILLAGVLDGHLGTAAAGTVEEEFPTMMTQELLLESSFYPTWEQNQDKEWEDNLGVRLESAWQKVCDFYRGQCSDGSDGEDVGCRVADYDSVEGVLDATTGSSDLVAGTTANLAALDKSTGQVALLNCGDSRSLVLDGTTIVFESVDHKPERELERFRYGQRNQQNSLYPLPQCRFSRWYVPVGEYEYKVRVVILSGFDHFPFI